MKIEKFEDLDVWNKAVSVYVLVFEISENSKLKNDFAARDQLRRAVLSISNNIAEGFEYESNLQFIRFLRYSKGSAGEARSMINVLYKTKQINEDQLDLIHSQLIELSKNIKGFMKYLKSTHK